MLQPISPTAHWTDEPLVLRPISPTTHLSYDPLVLRAIVPTVILLYYTLIRHNSLSEVYVMIDKYAHCDVK